MPSKVQHAKGRWGELLAKDYLSKKGYRFLTANFHTRHGEIDLIFLDEDTLVFVEVKVRHFTESNAFEDAITQEKIKRILKSAEIYIDKCDISFNEMRIDAFFITQGGEKIEISHIKNFV